MTWQFGSAEQWAAAGEWVGAVGTIAAVGVALWLARSERAPKINVRVYASFVYANQQIASTPVSLWALNDGPRLITLIRAEAEFVTSWPQRRSYGVVSPGPSSADTLPMRLEEGDRVQVFFPRREISKMLNDQGMTGRVTIRGFYADSTGRHYKANLTKSAHALRADL